MVRRRVRMGADTLAQISGLTEALAAENPGAVEGVEVVAVAEPSSAAEPASAEPGEVTTQIATQELARLVAQRQGAIDNPK